MIPCSLRNTFLACAFGFALLVSAAFACGQGLPNTDGRGPLYGKPAPEFQVKGIHGEGYALEALKGNILVIHFGTSW